MSVFCHNNLKLSKTQVGSRIRIRVPRNHIRIRQTGLDTESFRTSTSVQYILCYCIYYLKNRMNCTKMIFRNGWVHPILQIVLGKIANVARNWMNSVPQTEATTFAFSSVLFFYVYTCQLAKHLIRRWKGGLAIGRLSNLSCHS